MSYGFLKEASTCRIVRQNRSSSAPGKDTHQPTLRPTYQGVAQGGRGKSRHFYADRPRDAPRRGAYTPYKVANPVLEFSTSIPRTQLRPAYWDGFRGAPLHLEPSTQDPRP